MMEHCLTKAAIAYGDGAIPIKVKATLSEIPSLMMIDNLKDAKVALEGIFPTWSEKDITVVYKAQGTRINASSTTFEKGLCAMGSPCDATLPMAIDSAKAEVIWGKYEWNKCMWEFNLERLVEITHFDGCKFDMFVVEHGAMLSLRDSPPSPSAIVDIIKLHTDINNMDCIGQLITEGELHLRDCGPEKKSLTLGITDLKKIKWFQLEVDDFPTISQSLIVADARESIHRVFPTISQSLIVADAKPSMLGIHMALNILCLPSFWKLLKHLGSGLMSHVYLVDGSGSRLAVKTLRLLFNVNQDIYYLELLRGVDGVPVLQQKLHKMIALKPVCTSFSVETFFDSGTLALADLAETLGVVCSMHNKGEAWKDHIFLAAAHRKELFLEKGTGLCPPTAV